MASKGDLHSNLTEIAELDGKLWAAFLKAQKESALPIWDVKKVMSDSRRFYKEKRIPLRETFPLALVIVFIFAVASVFYPLFIALYVSALYWAFRCRKRFAHEWTKDQVGTEKYVGHAFGLENTSVAVIGLFSVQKEQGGRFSKEQLDSVIKLNKASHELGDVAFGIAEQTKKTIFAGTLPLGYWLATKGPEVSSVAISVLSLAKSNAFLAAVLLSMIVALTVLAYDLLIGQTRAKRQKKKYLLMLNLIRESWVEKK